jgi:hypothetical protein
VKIFNSFLVVTIAAALLTGCGSSPTPSQDEIEKAVASYVGMARADIGDVKLDDFKILKDYTKKVGDDDVFFRDFEAHYTVTYKNNPSKHSFTGTVAMHKQGREWSMRKDLCVLTWANSPPILDVPTQSALDKPNDPQSEESKQKMREQAAKGQTNLQ